MFVVRATFIASMKGPRICTDATLTPFLALSDVTLSHTYSEFANGTPRCMAAEHASKRFSSAGSPSTCAAWHVERHGIGRPLSDLAAAPQPSTPGPWALGGLRARPECVAQPRADQAQPHAAKVAGCGTGKAELSARGTTLTSWRMSSSSWRRLRT